MRTADDRFVSELRGGLRNFKSCKESKKKIRLDPMTFRQWCNNLSN